MLANFKNGIKKFKLSASIIFCFPAFLGAQPENLKAELDILNGLQSNAIRVIQKDKFSRIWLGTYQGLQVLNNSDPFIDSLQKTFQDKPVWALAFYKDYAIIGTRFNGLHIVDIQNQKRIKIYDSADIGLCRKFRIIDDTLYIATRANPYFIPLSNLKLFKIKSPDKNGFSSDFASWKGNIVSSFYQDSDGQFYKLQNDTLTQDKRFDLTPYPPLRNTLSVRSNDEQLTIGGNGFNLIVDSNNNIRSEVIRNPITDKCLPAWDVEMVDKRTYIATGDPDNTQQGMIHEPFVTTGKDLRNNFYGLSLYYDKQKNGMWAGTENAGLFYWPAISSYYHIPKLLFDNYKWYSADNGALIMFDNERTYEADLSTNRFTLLYQRQSIKTNGGILDVKMWNDTVAILTGKELILIKDARIIVNKSLPRTMYNTLEKIADKIILFSMYGDIITSIDLKNNTDRQIKAPSNQVSTLYFKNGVFYHSTYAGFGYYDTSSHVFSPGFPTIESFTITNDTLWILNSGVLTSYHIKLKDYQIEKIQDYNLKDKIKNFTPKWVVTISKTVYCGNNQGFVRLNAQSNEPDRYYYLGNYIESNTPKLFGDTLFFQHANYIAKITPEDLNHTAKTSSFEVMISPAGRINERSPFNIEIRSNDYLNQKRSLKLFVLTNESKDTIKLYSIDDKYELPSGLKRGHYELITFVNGTEVHKKHISIVIPLTSNPFFYVAIVLFLLAFIGLWVRYIFNKRKYERQILDNRLQLLKQNLNPHFIFNSLNLIYSLVLQQKNEAAIKTINNFSDLHRYYLENINKPKIKLSEELDFIESYLKLEAERREVDDPFIYHLNVLPFDNKEYMVPPMILQPLVENAVKYCSPDPAISQQSTIWIDISIDDTDLVISVENTVSANTERKMKGNGLGLKLVQERIEIYNKFFKEHIVLFNNINPTHSSSGYRAEIRI